MILISHRGNLDKINPELENRQSYIDSAILFGYDVEIDVWEKDGSLFLGHDEPTYPVSLDWLLDRKDRLWIHTKNAGALFSLIDTKLKLFYHQKENHTIIHNTNLVWSHELSEAGPKSIIPLLSSEQLKNHDGKEVYAICSDFVAEVIYVTNQPVE